MGVAQPKYFVIDKFYGVNEKDTETLLQLGEASTMSNWMITDDLKLQKMYGYAHMFATLGAHKVNGMWYGELSGTSYFLFACNGHIYKMNTSTGVNTDLGSVTDAYPTAFFSYNNTVYIMDGTGFFSWSGTGSIASVTGYTPTVLTASPPTGGGTILESMNYISGKKIQKFSATGSATVYQLAEYNITSVDSVVVGASTLIYGVDYTVNLANGTVIFVTAPTSGTNNVVITWTKVTAGNRELITNCKYYGGVFYSRHWLYGNANYKNTRYVSGITMAGVSDPTYWPMYADSNVGESEITAICIQYENQIVYTKTGAYYSYVETYTDSSTGLLITQFPVKNINTARGNVASGQVQIVNNNPLTIWKGIYEWSATNVQNEKNAAWISERVQADLDAVDLTAAITCDYSDKGLYLICVGARVWVLNYRVKAWYILNLSHTPSCFIVADSDLYFGTTDGYVMKFDETSKTYDGATFTAKWESGDVNFSTEYLMKNVKSMFVTLQPKIKAHVDITYKTDVLGTSDTYTAAYALTTFEHMDFAHFSFATNYSPQPFRFKLKAKKIDYFRLILTNDSTDTATVLSISLPVFYGREVKRR